MELFPLLSISPSDEDLQMLFDSQEGTMVSFCRQSTYQHCTFRYCLFFQGYKSSLIFIITYWDASLVVLGMVMLAGLYAMGKQKWSHICFSNKNCVCLLENGVDPILLYGVKGLHGPNTVIYCIYNILHGCFTDLFSIMYISLCRAVTVVDLEVACLLRRGHVDVIVCPRNLIQDRRNTLQNQNLVSSSPILVRMKNGAAI